MCQILKCLPSSIHGPIVNETLLKLIRDYQLLSHRKWKLLSILANMQFDEKWMHKYEDNILSAIYNVIDDRRFLSDVSLILMSHSSTRLLRSLIDHEVNHLYTNQCMLTSSSIYLLALYRKTHFLEPIGNRAQCIISSIQNCVDLLCAIKAIYNGIDESEVDHYPRFNHSDQEIDVDGLLLHQRVYYYEVHRIYKLYHYLHESLPIAFRANIPISYFATKYNIIDFLFEHIDCGNHLTRLNYENVRNVLLQNKDFNSKVHKLQSRSNDKVSELDLYQQYSVVKIMAETLLFSQTLSNYCKLINENLTRMDKILEDIEQPSAFVDVLEILYEMLFYRWEHAFGHYKQEITVDGSSSLTTIQESDTTDDYTDDSVFLQPRKTPKSHCGNDKSGFICSVMVLEAVLHLMNDMIDARKSDVAFGAQLDQPCSIRFENICDRIGDALWRLSLFELNNIPRESLQLSTEWKTLLARNNYLELVSSSDDEDEDNVKPTNTNSTVRRRPRRRVIFRRTEDKTCSLAHSTEYEKHSPNLMRNSVFVEKRSIISLMLGPPTNLVAICMTRGNMTDAKKLIEVRNVLICIKLFLFV